MEYYKAWDPFFFIVFCFNLAKFNILFWITPSVKLTGFAFCCLVATYGGKKNSPLFVFSSFLFNQKKNIK
jgi:hypothetical protein